MKKKIVSLLLILALTFTLASPTYAASSKPKLKSTPNLVKVDTSAECDDMYMPVFAWKLDEDSYIVLVDEYWITGYDHVGYNYNTGENVDEGNFNNFYSPDYMLLLDTPNVSFNSIKRGRVLCSLDDVAANKPQQYQYYTDLYFQTENISAVGNTIYFGVTGYTPDGDYIVTFFCELGLEYDYLNILFNYADYMEIDYMPYAYSVYGTVWDNSENVTLMKIDLIDLSHKDVEKFGYIVGHKNQFLYGLQYPSSRSTSGTLNVFDTDKGITRLISNVNDAYIIGDYIYYTQDTTSKKLNLYRAYLNGTNRTKVLSKSVKSGQYINLGKITKSYVYYEVSSDTAKTKYYRYSISKKKTTSLKESTYNEKVYAW